MPMPVAIAPMPISRASMGPTDATKLFMPPTASDAPLFIVPSAEPVFFALFAALAPALTASPDAST